MATAAEENLCRLYGGFLGPYNGEVYVVCKDGKWFHVRQDGTPLYEARFSLVFGGFSEGFGVAMHEDGKFFHIKQDGTPAYSAEFSNLGDFKNGVAAAANGGPWFLIDTTGTRTPATAEAAWEHLRQTEANFCRT